MAFSPSVPIKATIILSVELNRCFTKNKKIKFFIECNLTKYDKVLYDLWQIVLKID